MIFHYAGKYDGDEKHLPRREHMTGYVPFKEPQNMRTLAVLVNTIAIVVTLILLAVLWIRAGHFICNMIGFVLFLVCMIPHEILHALCFKRNVYMYQNLSQGMLFVVGTEDMSKSRFIWMSLCPNIIFGFLPFAIFMIRPDLEILGTLGALAIGAGAGDYLNVYNAITQMPRGAKTYMSGMHSFWYR